MNWILNKSRYISIRRAKQSKNRRKTKSHTKKGKNQMHQGHTAVRGWGTTVRPPITVRGVLHRQIVVGSVPPGPPLLELCILASFSALIWAAKLPMLGHFELPLLCSLIHMALNFTLSPITWLISHEFAIKTRKKPKQA